MTPKPLTRRQLYEKTWQTPMTNLSKELGLSPSGLAKICDRLLIPYPPRGHWSRVRSGKEISPPPLPDAPDDVPEEIDFSGGPKMSRRQLKRRTKGERAEELKGAARELIAEAGLHNLTMRTIAARIGLSEAQAHNYYTRDQLLIEIVQEELDAVEAARQASVDDGDGLRKRSVASMFAYLQEVEKRGSLLQDLLNLPAIRDALKQQREQRAESDVQEAIKGYETQYGVPEHIARPVYSILTSVTLRAGRLLATGRSDYDTLAKASLDIISAGMDRTIEKWGDPSAGGSLR